MAEVNWIRMKATGGLKPFLHKKYFLELKSYAEIASICKVSENHILRMLIKYFGKELVYSKDRKSQVKQKIEAEKKAEENRLNELKERIKVEKKKISNLRSNLRDRTQVLAASIRNGNSLMQVCHRFKITRLELHRRIKEALEDKTLSKYFEGIDNLKDYTIH